MSKPQSQPKRLPGVITTYHNVSTCKGHLINKHSEVAGGGGGGEIHFIPQLSASSHYNVRCTSYFVYQMCGEVMSQVRKQQLRGRWGEERRKIRGPGRQKASSGLLWETLLCCPGILGIFSSFRAALRKQFDLCVAGWFQTRDSSLATPRLQSLWMFPF